MLSLLGMLFLVKLGFTPTDAIHVFNRFSPEVLTNLGYGGHGSFRGQSYIQNPESYETVGQDIGEIEAEGPCYGKRCTANEHCCPGSVCVDVDGVVGSCLFAYGLRQGELCRRDNDCETGLLCTDTGEGRSCQPPASSGKQYNEFCSLSSECDIHKGLCCQFQRRHRQAPRKVCSYFKDPLICIGPVASDHIKFADIEHTSGEKRLTAKTTDSFAHLTR